MISEGKQKLVCQRHNQVAIAFDMNQIDSKWVLCQDCLIEKNNLEPANNIENKLSEIKIKLVDELKNLSSKNQAILNNLKYRLLKYKNDILSSIHNCASIIDQQVNMIQQQTEKSENLAKELQNCEVNQFLKQMEQISLSVINFKEIQEVVEKQLDLLNKLGEVTPLRVILNEIDYGLKSQSTQMVEKFIKKNNLFQKKIQKPLEYEQLYQSSLVQTQHCTAIAINKYKTIVVAAADKDINVYEFRNQKLKQVQQLSGHSVTVECLNFMKKTNQFISTGHHGECFIWSQNEKNSQWYLQQKLQSHTCYIECLTINNNEDLIVTGSSDHLIKFWSKLNEWICTQTIMDHHKTVYGLSLNESANLLVSCGKDDQILIMQLKEDNKWVIIQKIQNKNEEGYGICFITDDLFTYQPDRLQNMHIYERNQSSQKFEKTREIQVKGSSRYPGFHQQLVRDKQILVSSHGSYINLIRIKSDGELVTEQSIKFPNFYIYGCISDDAQYLITWDDGSKEIQVRKNKEE